MEQQELGKVIHNSKTTEHFNHSLLLCCSQPYFTAICTSKMGARRYSNTISHPLLLVLATTARCEAYPAPVLQQSQTLGSMGMQLHKSIFN